MKDGKKRVTVAAPKQMRAELSAVKGERYAQWTQSGMLRDLIRRGLILAREEKDARDA